MRYGCIVRGLRLSRANQGESLTELGLVHRELGTLRRWWGGAIGAGTLRRGGRYQGGGTAAASDG